ncbi:hypothetical protein BJ508DRAFT_415927 [Ascobolus immersus RN42]|uniref:LysM domain-containing protein n=1 Tax=Ascobolus immersus RN42 TaxID=1160509 RepID=A0A3N4ICK4_ASCIM|nr:hypothetical protein BJ508DRAFT_415927 [Ascobolus immersus RN42]
MKLTILPLLSLFALTSATATPEPLASNIHPRQLHPGTGTNGACPANRYVYVYSGDSCVMIARRAGITVSALHAANPFINAQCTNVWAQYYLCMATTGTATLKAPIGPPKKRSVRW